MYARAYINFKSQEGIILFRDRFNDFVFLNDEGQKYHVIVEFAPFPKAAQRRLRKGMQKLGLSMLIQNTENF